MRDNMVVREVTASPLDIRLLHIIRMLQPGPTVFQLDFMRLSAYKQQTTYLSAKMLQDIISLVVKLSASVPMRCLVHLEQELEIALQLDFKHCMS